MASTVVTPEYDYVETITDVLTETTYGWELKTDHPDCDSAGFSKHETADPDFWKAEAGYAGLVAYGRCPTCQKRFRLLLPRHLIVAMKLSQRC